MYDQLTIFDITNELDLLLNKIDFVDDKRNSFSDIKITEEQAKLFPYYYKMCRKTSDHYIRIYHKGHFKGEVTILSHGPDGCSNQLNDHDKGDLNLIQGLKKVLEVLCLNV